MFAFDVNFWVGAVFHAIWDNLNYLSSIYNLLLVSFQNDR